MAKWLASTPGYVQYCVVSLMLAAVSSDGLIWLFRASRLEPLHEVGQRPGLSLTVGGLLAVVGRPNCSRRIFAVLPTSHVTTMTSPLVLAKYSRCLKLPVEGIKKETRQELNKDLSTSIMQ